MNEGSIITKVAALSQDMQKAWNSDAFFTELMKIYGTSTSSINKALQNDTQFKAHKEDTDDLQAVGLLRSDLAIPNRAYFRFLAHDEDVRPAVDLIKALPEFNNPKAKLQFIVTCSPSIISIYDAVTDDIDTFPLSELAEHYSLLLPLTGKFQRPVITEGSEADAKACTKLTRLLEDLALRNQLKDDPEKKHLLNDFIRRVLFCLFAEDTGIFKDNQFSQAFAQLTDKQGSNAKEFFIDLFDVLDTPKPLRSHLGRPIAKEILDFPYVNGGLFKDDAFVPEFDLTTRSQLLDCGRLRWHEISPAIFGSMFQNALDPNKRREMGAHYTSEDNILKVINPLFMDGLRTEFEEILNKKADNSRTIKKRREDLMAFQNKLASIKVLDPACGCGNFLIIAYRELRRLENQVLDALFTDGFIVLADAIKVDINQFYGIEIEDWPAEIAHLSMWLMMHVMNEETAKKFGISVPSIPLHSSAVIKCTNALTTDWNEILPAGQCTYILGNPPFGGTTFTTKEQKEWLRQVYPPKAKVGLVDFVTAWFVKASNYMTANRNIEAAFVATNSICQGVQVGILWDMLLKRGIKINFAWKSFHWSNAAKNKAAVICVIVGFSYIERQVKKLFDSKDGTVCCQTLLNISPYLLPMQYNTIVKTHSKSLSAPLNLMFGNKAADGGNLIFDANEGKKILNDFPELSSHIKLFKGSDEIINGTWRYCFWCTNEEDYIKCSNNSKIAKRIEACKNFRLQSKKTATVRDAEIPWRFSEVNAGNPKIAIVIPRVSSERRSYVPMAFIREDTIISDRCFVLPNHA